MGFSGGPAKTWTDTGNKRQTRTEGKMLNVPNNGLIVYLAGVRSLKYGDKMSFETVQNVVYIANMVTWIYEVK